MEMSSINLLVLKCIGMNSWDSSREINIIGGFGMDRILLMLIRIILEGSWLNMECKLLLIFILYLMLSTLLKL
jgi:hypothetical protein